MIYDFENTASADGVFDFGGSIIVAALLVRGCVHIDDAAAYEVVISDYAKTIVALSDEAC